MQTSSREIPNTSRMKIRVHSWRSPEYLEQFKIFGKCPRITKNVTDYQESHRVWHDVPTMFVRVITEICRKCKRMYKNIQECIGMKPNSIRELFCMKIRDSGTEA